MLPSTGHIEGGEEQELVARYGKTLHADILAVPHHGSKTSSTWPFILAVSPEIAITQTGYLNRYGHPHPGITDRYDIMKTRLYRSDRDGAVLHENRPANRDGHTAIAAQMARATGIHHDMRMPSSGQSRMVSRHAIPAFPERL